MARPLRIQYPGACYHVMNWGASRQRIFIDEIDGKDFLDLLGETSDLFSIQIHADCLSDNHYHLIIDTPKDDSFRKRLNMITKEFHIQIG